MSYHDETLATDATSGFFMASQYIDLWVIGLDAGSLQLQVLFRSSKEESPPVWKDFPGGLFTSDVAKTIWVGEDDVLVRLVGSSNTDGVYIRFGRDS